jgi:transcriptional regulator with XRE-family HTH domain
MPAHRYTGRRRTQRQVSADDRAHKLAVHLGRSLKQARGDRGYSQATAAAAAGLAQTSWSELECGLGAAVSLRVWVRAGDAVGADLRAYLERASAADQPRDAVHLRHQELVARLAMDGGWQVDPEASLTSAGVADLLLTRRSEVALVEIWNWFGDVGDAFRSWDRKLERLRSGTDDPVSGCWIVRATRRNRDLLASHRTIFAARFPASASHWLGALSDPRAPMPVQPAILWVAVNGDRLFARRTQR